jgi:lipopolysaccharide export system permease protein
MRILDRYILSNFLAPFLYCFLGFIAIWLAFDLASNMNDFNAAHVPPRTIAYFYATQAPQIAVTILPVALLLSMLYSLSRMSRANEIISMLTAGQSLQRLIVPLLFVGLGATALSMAMEYESAPHADPTRKSMLDAWAHAGETRLLFRGLLFRNRTDHRTWYLFLKNEKGVKQAQTASLDMNDVLGVHITQQDADGNITRKYYATVCSFNPVTKAWTFQEGKTVDFNLDGDVTTQETWHTIEMKDWSETPWRIFSSNLDSQYLSVPELRDYLHYNADFPVRQLAPYRTYLYYRWALPAECLVIIFIAAPLGIVFSRRGVLVGVASSIFIYFGMMFIDKLSLALGKHGTLPPLLAAWGNNLFFLCIGLALLYMRSTNRDITWWTPKNIMRLFKRS